MKNDSEINDGRFKLQAKVGSGSFGDVYSALDKTNNEVVAMKVECKNSKSPQLETEGLILQDLQGCPNIPCFISYSENDSFRFLASELLGKNLYELFYLCNKKFSLKTVLMIIEETLNTIQFVHKKGYVYRDIKPNNFLIGRNENSKKIYLIDFGLTKKYLKENGEHIKGRGGQSIVGTARYASANALLGNQQSRRDDMIALGYLWIYFLTGTLPWIKVEDETRCGRYDATISLKKYTAPELLCSKLPNEFVKYFISVNSLEFDEEPKYDQYRMMFRTLFAKNNFSFDYVYDWTGHPSLEPPKVRQPKKARSRRESAVVNRLVPLHISERYPSNQQNFSKTSRPAAAAGDNNKARRFSWKNDPADFMKMSPALRPKIRQPSVPTKKIFEKKFEAELTNLENINRENSYDTEFNNIIKRQSSTPLAPYSPTGSRNSGKLATKPHSKRAQSVRRQRSISPLPPISPDRSLDYPV